MTVLVQPSKYSLTVLFVHYSKNKLPVYKLHTHWASALWALTVSLCKRWSPFFKWFILYSHTNRQNKSLILAKWPSNIKPLQFDSKAGLSGSQGQRLRSQNSPSFEMSHQCVHKVLKVIPLAVFLILRQISR